MKKLKVLLLLVLVLFTTGCGKRVPTTEEKFKDAFKDYKVEDVTSDFNFVNKAFKVTGSNDLVVIFLSEPFGSSLERDTSQRISVWQC